MRNLSAPILPLSSGTLPGQISMTNGSAAAADAATTNETSTAAADTMGCMVEFLRHEVFNWHGSAFRPIGRKHRQHQCAGRQFVFVCRGQCSQLSAPDSPRRHRDKEIKILGLSSLTQKASIT